MKNLKYLITLFGISLILFSCTKRIDLDLNTLDNQKLVVQSWFTNQMKKHEVKLTLTVDYFGGDTPPPATSAVISITDGSQTWDLVEEEPGIYRTPEIAGVFDTEYKLSIDWSDEHYEATSFLREVAPLDSLSFAYVDPEIEFGFPGDPWYNVQIWSQELEGLGDSYFWTTWVNGVNLRTDLSDISFVDDQLYDGSPIPGIDIDILDTPDEAVIGDTIFVEQWNIGYDTYEMFESILEQTDWRGGLFDTPPSNIPTNLSNGALGYFGAAGVSSREAILAID